jgi:hypothetical protein
MSSLGLDKRGLGTVVRSVSLASLLAATTVVAGAASVGCATAEGGDGLPAGDTGTTDTAHPDTSTQPDSGADTATKPDTSTTDTATGGDTATSADTATGGDTGADAADTATSPPGETCASATTVTLDASGHASMTGQTTTGFAEDYAASGPACRAGIAADRVYVVKVPAGKKLSATVTPTDLTFDPVLNVVLPTSGTDCSTGDCVVPGVDVGYDGHPETIGWLNDKGAETTVYVVVDSRQSDYTAQGDYDIDITVADQPKGEVCSDPRVVTLTGTTTTLTGETLVGFANDYGTGTNCSGTGGIDRVYAIDVPANTRATITVKPTGTSWDPALNLQDAAACGVTPRVCLSGTDSGGSGTAETLKYTNTGATTKSIRAVVETYSSSSSGGTFDFTVALATLPANDACTGAIAIGASGSVTGDTTAASSDYTGGTNCLGTAGNDVVYSIDVPAGKQLAATVLGTGFAPTLDIVDATACGSTAARSCLGSVATGTAGTAGTARWTNGGTTTRTVHLVVDSTSATSFGTFTILTAFSDPPAGDTCANAFTTLKTDGTAVSDTTVGATNDYATGTGCGGSGGPDKVYAVSVPAGKVLSTTVVGIGGFVPSISYQSAAQCSAAPRVCSGSVSTTSGSPTGTIRYANESTTASETIYVVVDSTATAGGAYSLTAGLSDIAKTGDVCGTAEVITAGTNLTGLTTVGYGNEYDGGSVCKAASGPDRVFAVTVPNNKQLTALVNPDATFDPTLSLIAGTPANCAAHVCNASVDAKTAGQPETTSYSNKTGADQTVFIIVDSASTTASSGGFSLFTTLTDVSTGGGTGSVGGETCDVAPALSLGATPTVIAGDFQGYQNDFTYANTGTTCYFWTGPDMAWGVTIPAGQTLTATITHSLTSNPYMSFIIGSAGSCLGAATCATKASAYSPGGTMTYTNSTGADVSGFLILDYAYGSATVSTSAPFSLSLTVN